MNLKEILEVIWNDRIKGGGWRDKEHFIDHFLSMESPSNQEPLTSYKVGDLIEFDFFGTIKRGSINSIGKHGYWIASDHTVNGSIRCEFHKAKLISKLPQRDKPLTGTTCDEPILSVERDKSAETKSAEEFLRMQLKQDNGQDLETDFPKLFKQICETIQDFASQNKPSGEGKWISVKDRLPEDAEIGYSVPIITYSDVNGVREGIYDICKEKFRTIDDDQLMHENLKFVTHWIPFPE